MASIKPVVALGLFDGMHLGHRAILRRAKELSERFGAPLIATTFADGIETKGFKAAGLIYDENTRTAMLKAAGADFVEIFPANERFFNTDAAAFLDDLIDRFNPKAVVMGEDFTYGRGKHGTAETAKRYFQSAGILLEAMPLKNSDGKKISTTEIKALLREGKIDRANALLGAAYFLTGTVREGRGDGTKHGFPTANFEIPDRLVVPKDGVYATETEVFGRLYVSLTNVGSHPTFGDFQRNVETYLLDFRGNLYGKSIKVRFLRKIRDIQHFLTPESLYDRLRTDIEEVRNDEIRSGGEFRKFF